MGTGYANNEGGVTEKLVKHYEDRSRNVGLVIVEHSFVAQSGRASSTQLGIHNDGLIPGLTQLVDAVHRNDAPVAIQLNHGGGTSSSEITGVRPLAPSAVMHPRRGKEIPEELSESEIEDIIIDYKNAARRAINAGFDAVEIHGAHGYLLSQFLSPITNKRRDDYGGTLENRARLSCTIIEEMKRDLGSNSIILYRLGADDIYPGGMPLSEGVKAGRMIADSGVNIIDISGGIGGGGMDDLKGPGYFVPHAAAVKEVVEIPVIGVGGIQTAAEADQIIRSGKVDLVAIGRAILEEPEWAKQALKELGA
jgi:2,4-dienoyl-CoA reductase-like NADH-dependent reductase (Old Yellow Enzyme family)